LVFAPIFFAKTFFVRVLISGLLQ